MTNYIPADKLIHDLEERIYAYSEGYANGDNYRKDAIETLLKDVKYQLSLQQEQTEVDLEKETKRWWKEHLHLNPENKLWMDAHQSVVFARYFYELGRKQVLQEIYDGKTKPVDKITAAWLDD